MDDTAWIKLALLSQGITASPEFGDWFAGTEGYVRRRNFYNSPNWDESGTSAALPQEIRLTGGRPVVVAVNNYGSSSWQLTWSEAGGPAIVSEARPDGLPIELVNDLASIRGDTDLARVSNLYGGSALSFFSPRACYFFADGTQCRFCSLDGTARENDEYAGRVTPDEVRSAVAAVVATDSLSLNQVMIVGGNERNLDRGFVHQLALVDAATQALADAGLVDEISVHLIAMPPHDLDLIDRLSEVPNVHAGFNLEVWDPDRFTTIAPGKTADYGQANILAALGRLRDAVGPYRAHSILIAGLEPANSTLDGARKLAADGISPIINSYHSDRHSALGLTIRPSYRHLAEVASGLQELHDLYPIQPYWKGCGRNALDYEASLGMFRGSPPDFN
ncbi:radical SAM protein [Nonomuraea sp. NPDC046570]|uniref:radical SAM protein n=1 Tax=Nonomuraea sp. NPDC046570 TaxID=3155255 RepID=UPI0033FEA275